MAATASRPDARQPWQGLTELYTHTQEHAKLAPPLRALLDSAPDAARAADLRAQLAAALAASGSYLEALPLVDWLIQDGEARGDLAKVPLDLLRLKAECQVAADAAECECCVQHALKEARESGQLKRAKDAREEEAIIRQNVTATWVRSFVSDPCGLVPVPCYGRTLLLPLLVAVVQATVAKAKSLVAVAVCVYRWCACITCTHCHQVKSTSSASVTRRGQAVLPLYSFAFVLMSDLMCFQLLRLFYAVLVRTETRPVR